MAKSRPLVVVEKRFRRPHAEADDDDRYMRLSDLSRYSSLSVTTLRRFIADTVHPLPVHRVLDRVWLVKKQEFDRWVQEREAMVAARAPRAPVGVPADIRRAALARRGWPVDP